MDNPMDGVRLFFSDGSLEPGLYRHSSQIWYYRDPQGYFIIRIAAFFDLLTFSSYSATAVLFAVLSFIGAWLMFKVFYGIAPDFHRWIGVSCLFIPTVFFWGSGLFKDTITLAALGISLYCFYSLFIVREYSLAGTLVSVFFLILSLWVIFSVKKYILLSFLPVILFWFFSQRLARIKSFVFKLLFVPLAIIPILLLAFYTVTKIGEDDARYNIEKLAETAQITAYDIRYGWGARTGEGSGYTLGELDGTWQSMLKLAPAAINVSLFRPYVWEISSPLMVLSALESLGFLVITLFVLYQLGLKSFKYLQKPEVIFCLGFSIMFAFAVGVSTYNFGTLSRYKIPLLPFYALGIGFMYYYSKKDKELERLKFVDKDANSAK